MSLSQVDSIPRSEYGERVRRVQQEMRREGLDAVIAFGSACEPQYLRYLADFRVAFETGGVAIPSEGGATVLAGPETAERAQLNNPLDETMKLSGFREASAPQYEQEGGDSFETLFRRYGAARELRKVGIVGWRIVPMDLYREIEAALHATFPEAELVPADGVVDRVRMRKSEAEVALLRKAARIARETLECMIARLRPGMTGEQIRGMAIEKMVELGAEGEAFPMWVTRQEQTEFAINIPDKEGIRLGDLVQLQIGASVNGYCSACGRPVIVGEADAPVRELIEACRDAKRAVERAFATARTSGEVARAHREQVIASGHERHIVYGPCHSVGLVECEGPWIEVGSDYELQPGMVFCEDIFLSDPAMHRGVRFEDMVLVTEAGFERLTGMSDDVLVLPCE